MTTLLNTIFATLKEQYRLFALYLLAVMLQFALAVFLFSFNYKSTYNLIFLIPVTFSMSFCWLGIIFFVVYGLQTNKLLDKIARDPLSKTLTTALSQSLSEVVKTKEWAKEMNTTGVYSLIVISIAIGINHALFGFHLTYFLLMLYSVFLGIGFILHINYYVRFKFLTKRLIDYGFDILEEKQDDKMNRTSTHTDPKQ